MAFVMKKLYRDQRSGNLISCDIPLTSEQEKYLTPVPEKWDAESAKAALAKAKALVSDSVSCGIPRIKSTKAVLRLVVTNVFHACGGPPKPGVTASYLRTLAGECERAAKALDREVF